MQARDAVAAFEAGNAAAVLGRYARAVELFERALAAADADATLPRDSLLLSMLLQELVHARMRSVTLPRSSAEVASSALDVTRQLLSAYDAAWRTEPRMLALSQRALALLLARFNAGTLFAPLTPVERASWYSHLGGEEEEDRTTQRTLPRALPWQRAGCFFNAARDAAAYWPPLSDPAAEEARLRGVAGAARASLTLFEHDVWGSEGQRELGQFSVNTAGLLFTMLMSCLQDETMASGGLLGKLRALNALTRAEEETLRQRVLPAVMQLAAAGIESVEADIEADARRATADVARHGLRACALPGCGATEAQPKAFKVCGRCRRVCYCSAAHQQQDWRRHKRADACAAAPQ
jgi:hypothetical protein